MVTSALTAVQAVAVLAVLAGVALALPLYGALIVDGLLVLSVAVAAEHIAQRRPGGPSDRRSGDETVGVE